MHWDKWQKIDFVYIQSQYADPDEISKFISSELKLHISTIKTIAISEIPLTSNGKVDYNKLIAEYGNKWIN